MEIFLELLAGSREFDNKFVARNIPQAFLTAFGSRARFHKVRRKVSDIAHLNYTLALLELTLASSVPKLFTRYVRGFSHHNKLLIHLYDRTRLLYPTSYAHKLSLSAAHILGVIDGVTSCHFISAGRFALTQRVVFGVVSRTVFHIVILTAQVVYVTTMSIVKDVGIGKMQWRVEIANLIANANSTHFAMKMSK